MAWPLSGSWHDADCTSYRDQEKALATEHAKWLSEELDRKSELLQSERRASSDQVPTTKHSMAI